MKGHRDSMRLTDRGADPAWNLDLFGNAYRKLGTRNAHCALLASRLHAINLAAGQECF
jgi:hypothetical protein